MKNKKICPYCKEDIKPDATKCPHCGSRIFQWSTVWEGLIIVAVTGVVYWVCANLLMKNLIGFVQKMAAR